MVKLIYGLAKFSNQRYGFGSKPKTLNKKKFLSDIQKNFDIFECGDRYYKSIKYVELLRKKDIHFKIDKIPVKRNIKIIESYFKNNIKSYIATQNLKKIKVLYLHENSLKIISNTKVLKVLKKLKKNKIVKKFGVSIYSENELKFAIHSDLYDYIQIPLNLSDSYLFFKYKNQLNKKKIVARSLALQGTLLNSITNFKFKNKINEYIKKIDSICSRNNITREELVYRFVFSLNMLDYAIVGSINQTNIKNIIKYKKKNRLNDKIMKELINLSKQKKRWANPRNWV